MHSDYSSFIASIDSDVILNILTAHWVFSEGLCSVKLVIHTDLICQFFFLLSLTFWKKCMMNMSLGFIKEGKLVFWDCILFKQA